MIFSISLQKLSTFLKKKIDLTKARLKKIKSLSFIFSIGEFFVCQPIFNSEKADLICNLKTQLISEQICLKNKILSFNVIERYLYQSDIQRFKSEIVNLNTQIQNCDENLLSMLSEFSCMKENASTTVNNINSAFEGVFVFFLVVGTCLVLKRCYTNTYKGGGDDFPNGATLPSVPEAQTQVSLPIQDLPTQIVLPIPDLPVSVDVLENARRVLEKFIPVCLDKIGQNPGLPPINTKSELVELLKIVKESVHHYFSMAGNPYFNSFELMCQTTVEVHNTVLLCIQKSEI